MCAMEMLNQLDCTVRHQEGVQHSGQWPVRYHKFHQYCQAVTWLALTKASE